MIVRFTKKKYKSVQHVLGFSSATHSCLVAVSLGWTIRFCFVPICVLFVQIMRQIDPRMCQDKVRCRKDLMAHQWGNPRLVMSWSAPGLLCLGEFWRSQAKRHQQHRRVCPTSGRMQWQTLWDLKATVRTGSIKGSFNSSWVAFHIQDVCKSASLEWISIISINQNQIAKLHRFLNDFALTWHKENLFPFRGDPRVLSCKKKTSGFLWRHRWSPRVALVAYWIGTMVLSCDARGWSPNPLSGSSSPLLSESLLGHGFMMIHVPGHLSFCGKNAYRRYGILVGGCWGQYSSPVWNW